MNKLKTIWMWILRAWNFISWIWNSTQKYRVRKSQIILDQDKHKKAKTKSKKVKS